MPAELAEALAEAGLTAAGVPALLAKVIDPLLLEYQRRYSPLVRALPSKKWTSDQYYFNTRTSKVPGGFVTDGGARPVGSSVYAQNNFQMRHLQAVGSVTGYTQEVTREVIGDLRRQEIESAISGLLWDIETGVVWGSSAATLNGPYPQFDGFDQFFSTYTGSGSTPQNAIDEQGSALSLSMLDNLIDMVESNAAMSVDNSPWMFVASPTANSKLAQLFTNQQRFLDKVEVAPGLNVASYRDVPVIKSSFLAARSAAMSAVTTTPHTSGGSLADATYHYQVSAVIARYGETLPCVDVTAVVASGGGAGSVTLAFTPPAGPEAGLPLLYKVYRHAGSGTSVLVGLVDGNVGLSADGVTPIVTTSIIDTGTALIPQNGSTVPATLPAAYFGGSGVQVRSGESLFLVSRNPDFIVRPFVREVTPVDVYPTTASPDSLPFALISDTTLAVRAPKYGGRLANVAVSL